jgi:hypothetical protein
MEELFRELISAFSEAFGDGVVALFFPWTTPEGRRKPVDASRVRGESTTVDRVLTGRRQTLHVNDR